MDTKQLQSRLEGYNNTFSDLGYFKPFSSFRFYDSGRCEIFASGQREERWSSDGSEAFIAYGNSPEEALTEMDQKIALLEPRDKREKDTFLRDVAKLTEKARDLGFDHVADESDPSGHVDYAAQLQNLLDSLSKNILEDQRSTEHAE
jgi:hypothetical protein